nr:IclR family transcriptional regulator [Variovorax sp. OV329]
MELAAQIERDWASEVQRTPSTPPAWLVGAPGKGSRPPDPEDRSFARTLARGVDLLLCFSPTDPALGNRELARRLDLGPTTVVRLTHTLCERGYLRRDANDGKYRLGAATLAAAYPILSGLRIRRLARPAMLALAQRVQGAVSLGLRHQSGMVYVETAWRTDERLLPPDTGAPMPMLLTAMGRAWLSRADRTKQREVLNRIRLHDPQGWQRHQQVALEEAALCRRRGWCSSRDFRSEIVAVAVPFRQPVDSVQYVMNCGVLARGVASRRQLAGIGEALQETVREVEALAAQG